MNSPDRSDEIAALLNLDPSHLSDDDRHLTHPACAYAREPWSQSGVVAFPVARNRAAMARIAVKAAEGRSGSTMASALARRARELHAAQVPRDAALADLAAMHREISGMVAVLVSTEGGSRHGGC